MIDFASEMGIDYDTFLDLTWKKYEYYSIGYMRRIEREWDYTRHLISSMFNSSGFSKKRINPKEIMQLPMLDTVQPFKRVSDSTLDHLLKVRQHGNN